MVINMYLLNCFFVYSILGYILEIIFGFLIGAHPKSGVLYGPWTPIYGIASVLIIIISDKLFKKLHMARWKETIIVFFIITIILTLLECLGGYLIEIIFGFSFWDYSDYKYNIGKYMCLEMALIWGILSIIFIYLIRPFLDKYIKKTPLWGTALILIVMFIDFMIRLLVEFHIL